MRLRYPSVGEQWSSIKERQRTRSMCYVAIIRYAWPLCQGLLANCGFHTEESPSWWSSLDDGEKRSVPPTGGTFYSISPSHSCGLLGNRPFCANEIWP